MLPSATPESMQIPAEMSFQFAVWNQARIRLDEFGVGDEEGAEHFLPLTQRIAGMLAVARQYFRNAGNSVTGRQPKPAIDIFQRQRRIEAADGQKGVAAQCNRRIGNQVAVKQPAVGRTVRPRWCAPIRLAHWLYGTVGVDGVGIRMHQRQIGEIPLGDRGLDARHFFRVETVIGAEQVHPFPAAGFDAGVRVRADPAVLAALKNNMAKAIAVGIKKTFGYLEGVIGRAIVDQHQFKFGVGLRAHGGETGLDIPGMAVGGNGNADQRQGHGLLPFPAGMATMTASLLGSSKRCTTCRALSRSQDSHGGSLREISRTNSS